MAVCWEEEEEEEERVQGWLRAKPWALAVGVMSEKDGKQIGMPPLMGVGGLKIALLLVKIRSVPSEDFQLVR